MRIAKEQSSGTREIIRVAEKHIEAREFELAMQKLSVAQRMDPENMYINAIVERIHRLASESPNGGRFLALTVGDEFEDGIKPEGANVETVEDLEARIKKLTTKASDLVRRGAYETAFDSLMNAYLLDPVSPYLMETEKTLLPAIETMRKQATGRSGSQKNNPLAQLPPSERKADPSVLTVSESQRLEELKRQKEAERLEREREMWREASKPLKLTEEAPKFLEEILTPIPPKGEEESTSDTPKESTGFFAKLRHRKSRG